MACMFLNNWQVCRLKFLIYSVPWVTGDPSGYQENIYPQNREGKSVSTVSRFTGV